MKCIGIISAMWIEAELLHQQMKQVETFEYCGMKYYQGTIHNTNVVLSTCGVGKVNAAIYTQIMIEKFHVDAILHTGIAGSMDKNVKHLSLVIADGLTYYDVRKEQLIHCFPNQEIFKPAKELVDLILGASDSDTHVGLIITGDDFIADHEYSNLSILPFVLIWKVRLSPIPLLYTKFHLQSSVVFLILQMEVPLKTMTILKDSLPKKPLLFY
jgi:adenosylhomocysteine nucleosidase